jgi:hypothetical protein
MMLGECLASPRYMGIRKYPAVDVYSMKTRICISRKDTRQLLVPMATYMLPNQEEWSTTISSNGFLLRKEHNKFKNLNFIRFKIPRAVL